VPQLGSTEGKSCTDKSSAAWLYDETRNRQLQQLSRPHRLNVSLPLPTKSQTLPKARTQKPRKREKKQIEQAGFLELPHDRSCCTTEICKIFLLLS